MKLITYFYTSPIKKPTPSQINLIKNAKNHLLLLRKFKKIPKLPSSAEPQATKCPALAIVSHLPLLSPVIVAGVVGHGHKD